MVGGGGRAKGETLRRLRKWLADNRDALIRGLMVTGGIGFLLLLIGILADRLMEHVVEPRVWQTATPTRTPTPVPTQTPNWQMREEVSGFVREFWRAEETAFDTGELESLEAFFCTSGRFHAPLLEPFDAFSQYKADAENMMASELCPFSLDDIQYPEEPPSTELANVQVLTVEGCADGPCPTDGSSGLQGLHRRFVLEGDDSGWCIADSSPWRVVPE